MENFMDPFFNLLVYGVNHLLKLYDGRRHIDKPSKVNEEQEEYCKKIFESMDPFCKPRPQVGQQDPQKTKPYYVIAFERPSSSRLVQKIHRCREKIYDILSNRCDQDLAPDYPPNNEACQKIIELMKTEWQSRLCYDQFKAQPVEWGERWRQIKDRVEKVPTKYPDPSSRPLEDWKNYWLTRMRALIDNLENYSLAMEQNESKEMGVNVIEVKDETVIERLVKLKQDLVDFGSDICSSAPMNFGTLRQFYSVKKPFPRIEGFKDHGIKEDTITFFIVRAKEVVQQKVYERGGILTRPRKFEIVPLPKPEYVPKKKTTSQSLLFEEVSFKNSQNYDESVDWERYCHQIIEGAVDMVNEKLDG